MNLDDEQQQKQLGRGLEKFLTLPGEELILARRQHWITLSGPIFLIIFLGLLFATANSYIFLFLYQSFLLYFALSLVGLVIMAGFITKSVIDWYGHLYVVTSRKIMEIICVPLFSDSINDVLLDQVRTIEVDAKINGMVDEVFDVGDVVVAFDRPSKDKVFILSRVANPREVGTFLGDQLESMMEGSPVWFQRKTSSSHQQIRLSEDIYPERQVFRS